MHFMEFKLFSIQIMESCRQLCRKPMQWALNDLVDAHNEEYIIYIMDYLDLVYGPV